MNDSTSENPAEVPGLNAADTVPAVKKPAAKRAPRKKAEAVLAEEAVPQAVVAMQIGTSVPVLEAAAPEVPVAQVQAVAMDSISPEAVVSAAEGEGNTRQAGGGPRGESRERPQRPDGAGRDKRLSLIHI